MSTATYRWNARQAAVDYDAAGPVIHPCYDEAQESVVDALPFSDDGAPHIVDLGGGSGRLAERLLRRFPAATVTVVDPSKPFLELASQRLRGFERRARLVCSTAQEAWEHVVTPVDAVVSTSALHHLEGAEKSAVFAAIRKALKPGGVFVNGDEYRPPADSTYRELLEEWGEHLDSAVATGAIPETFREVIAKWRSRNLEGFGGERVSGDDCHETIEEQTARLYGTGFSEVRTTWSDRLWAVLVARTVD